jgi:hypothetical protein
MDLPISFYFYLLPISYIGINLTDVLSLVPTFILFSFSTVLDQLLKRQAMNIKIDRKKLVFILFGKEGSIVA